MNKRYYKYYICGEVMIRAITKEIALKKFKKLGKETQEIRSFSDYKKAARLIESMGGINNGTNSEIYN